MRVITGDRIVCEARPGVVETVDIDSAHPLTDALQAQLHSVILDFPNISKVTVNIEIEEDE